MLKYVSQRKLFMFVMRSNGFLFVDIRAASLLPLYCFELIFIHLQLLDKHVYASIQRARS